MISDQGKSRAIMTASEHVTYRLVASAAAAAVAAAAARTSVLGEDLSETKRAGSVQRPIHLAARHHASFRPSWVPPG